MKIYKAKSSKWKTHKGYIQRKPGLVFQNPLPVKLHRITHSFLSKAVVTTPVKCFLLEKLIRYSVTRTVAVLCVEILVLNVNDKRCGTLKRWGLVGNNYIIGITTTLKRIETVFVRLLLLLKTSKRWAWPLLSLSWVSCAIWYLPLCYDIICHMAKPR